MRVNSCDRSSGWVSSQSQPVSEFCFCLPFFLFLFFPQRTPCFLYFPKRYMTFSKQALIRHFVSASETGTPSRRNSFLPCLCDRRAKASHNVTATIAWRASEEHPHPLPLPGLLLLPSLFLPHAIHLCVDSPPPVRSRGPPWLVTDPPESSAVWQQKHKLFAETLIPLSSLSGQLIVQTWRQARRNPSEKKTYFGSRPKAVETIEVFVQTTRCCGPQRGSAPNIVSNGHDEPPGQKQGWVDSSSSSSSLFKL